MTSAYEKCPVCGKTLKAENLAAHLQEVHPRQAGEEAVRLARRRAAQSAKGADTTQPVPKTFPWKWIAVAVVAVVIVIAALYAASVITSQPFDPFQCVENTGGRVVHFHAYMNISINLIPLEIPGDIGIRAGCTGIIHTHESEPDERRTDGVGFTKMHFEGPASHRYTIGDFFTVWGIPFSAFEIAGFPANPNGTGAKIFMTVDNQVSGEYERYILDPTSCDTLDTCHQFEIVYNP